MKNTKNFPTLSGIIQEGVVDVMSRLQKHRDLSDHVSDRIVEKTTHHIDGDTSLSDRSVMERKIEKGGVK